MPPKKRKASSDSDSDYAPKISKKKQKRNIPVQESDKKTRSTTRVAGPNSPFYKYDEHIVQPSDALFKKKYPVPPPPADGVDGTDFDSVFEDFFPFKAHVDLEELINERGDTPYHGIVKPYIEKTTQSLDEVCIYKSMLQKYQERFAEMAQRRAEFQTAMQSGLDFKYSTFTKQDLGKKRPMTPKQIQKQQERDEFLKKQEFHRQCKDTESNLALQHAALAQTQKAERDAVYEKNVAEAITEDMDAETAEKKRADARANADRATTSVDANLQHIDQQWKQQQSIVQQAAQALDLDGSDGDDEDEDDEDEDDEQESKDKKKKRRKVFKPLKQPIDDITDHLVATRYYCAYCNEFSDDVHHIQLHDDDGNAYSDEEGDDDEHLRPRRTSTPAAVKQNKVATARNPKKAGRNPTRGRKGDDDEDEDDDEQDTEVCPCGECGSEVERPMIGCDTCEQWYHFECLGIPTAGADNIETWLCPPCSGHALTFGKKYERQLALAQKAKEEAAAREAERIEAEKLAKANEAAAAAAEQDDDDEEENDVPLLSDPSRQVKHPNEGVNYHKHHPLCYCRFCTYNFTNIQSFIDNRYKIIVDYLESIKNKGFEYQPNWNYANPNHKRGSHRNVKRQDSLAASPSAASLEKAKKAKEKKGGEVKDAREKRQSARLKKDATTTTTTTTTTTATPTTTTTTAAGSTTTPRQTMSDDANAASATTTTTTANTNNPIGRAAALMRTRDQDALLQQQKNQQAILAAQQQAANEAAQKQREAEIAAQKAKEAEIAAAKREAELQAQREADAKLREEALALQRAKEAKEKQQAAEAAAQAIMALQQQHQPQQPPAQQAPAASTPATTLPAATQQATATSATPATGLGLTSAAASVLQPMSGALHGSGNAHNPTAAAAASQVNMFNQQYFQQQAQEAQQNYFSTYNSTQAQQPSQQTQQPMYAGYGMNNGMMHSQQGMQQGYTQQPQQYSQTFQPAQAQTYGGYQAYGMMPQQVQQQQAQQQQPHQQQPHGYNNGDYYNQ